MKIKDKKHRPVGDDLPPVDTPVEVVRPEPVVVEPPKPPEPEPIGTVKFQKADTDDLESIKRIFNALISNGWTISDIFIFSYPRTGNYELIWKQTKEK